MADLAPNIRRPDFITFTGVDDATAIADMHALSMCYPIEWGILLSPKRQGADPRYPSNAVIGALLAHADSALRFAAHLCGDYARAIMDAEAANLRGSLTAYLGHSLIRFRRAQINHYAPNASRIREFQRVVGLRCIAQTRASSFPTDDGIDWLFDQSGGTGTAPEDWPPHPGCLNAPHRLVGYAGGIRPDNVVAVLTKINARGPYWIDMESGVRTNNWLDLTKCRAVCEAVYGARQ